MDETGNPASRNAMASSVLWCLDWQKGEEGLEHRQRLTMPLWIEERDQSCIP